MPHLVLEYTRNISARIEFDRLFAELHEVLCEVGGIDIDNCKSRAVALDEYYVGDGGTDNAFVHLAVSFLEGRTAPVKREIGRRLLQYLREHYAKASEMSALQISVEIKDIQRPLYFKFPELV